MRKKKIAIIGGGMGGLSTAASLLQRGFEVELFEQAHELAEVGAGVQITPNAIKVLRGLGLEQHLDTYAFKPEAIVGLDWKTGRQAFRTPLRGVSEQLYGADYYQIHRADLHRILRMPVPDSAIHLSSRCVGVENKPSSAVARFENGREVEADLIVAADGVKSPIRHALFDNPEPRYTGNMCWRAVVPLDPPDHKLVLPSSSMWFGPGGHVVTYYVSAGKAVNIVAVMETSDWVEESWTVPSSADEMLQAFKGWHPRLLELLSRAENVFKWGLFDRDPMPTWTVGRVTLLGDAAHPMLPFLSQGAGMAMEDGYILARALEKYDDDIFAALSAYEAARIPRTRRVQLGARERGRSYHLTSPIARIGRDIVHFVRGLFNSHSTGLKASWVYEHDVMTYPLDDKNEAMLTPQS